jgi:perosamine synthetase
LTFIAPANAVRYIGAWPVLIDVERKHWQMDADKVIDFLENKCVWRDDALYNNSTGRRVKAILPVDILGHPVDMDPILAAAKKYNLAVVEDATESLGAKYKGRLLGTLGGITSFSFNGNKIITTGGGGMIVTDNEEWARHAKYLTTQAKDDPIEYVHKETGYNYRLTNLLAAVGCAQLEQLPEFILAKRRTAANYLKALAGIPGITPMSEAEWAYSTFWLFTILVDPKVYGIDSRALMKKMLQANIQTRPLWQVLHRSPSLANCGHFDCPVADDLYRMALSLPCSVGLKDEEFQHVVDVLTENKNAK